MEKLVSRSLMLILIGMATAQNIHEKGNGRHFVVLPVYFLYTWVF